MAEEAPTDPPKIISIEEAVPDEAKKTQVGKILYCFAGAARKCDVAHFVKQRSSLHGTKVEVEELDIIRGGASHDLSNDSLVGSLVKRIHAGEFGAAMLTPPCNTHSRAMYSNKPGPLPLRSKEHPHGLPHLNQKQIRKVELADKLIENTIQLAHASFESGVPFIIEHPENLGSTPKGTPASIWDLDEIRKLASRTKAHTASIYQCRDPTGRGELEVAESPKPTRLLGTAAKLLELRHHGWPQIHEDGSYQGPLPRSCGHKHGKKLIGLKECGNEFKTEAAAAYPPALCDWLAEALIAEVLAETNRKKATPRGRGKEMRKLLPMDQWDTSDEDELGEPKWLLGSGPAWYYEKERDQVQATSKPGFFKGTPLFEVGTRWGHPRCQGGKPR